MNKYLAPALVGFVATLSLSHGASHAATIINQNITFLSAPYPEGEAFFTFCEDQNICELGFQEFFTAGTGFAVNINNNDNDTDLTFGKLVYELLSPDAEWGTVTTNGELTIDGKIAIFEGLMPPGSGFRVARTLEGDGNPVDFSVTFEGVHKAVPEPASILGLLAVGAFGAGLTRQKKQAK